MTMRLLDNLNALHVQGPFQILGLMFVAYVMMAVFFYILSALRAFILGTKDFLVDAWRYKRSKRVQPLEGQTWSNGLGEVYHITSTLGPNAIEGVCVRKNIQGTNQALAATLSLDEWEAHKAKEMLYIVNNNNHEEAKK